MRVPRKRGERARKALIELGYLDKRRRIAEDGDCLLIPILVSAPKTLDLEMKCEVMYADLEGQDEQARPRSLREAPGLPPEVASEVTRSLDIVGDIAIIRLNEEHLPRAEEIGRAILELHPRLRAVAVDSGVQGPHRVRALQLAAGEGPLVTLHRENGLKLRVDLERAYFSPRLATEHRRVAALVREGERVLDMFAGVGPFSVLIAVDRRASEVHAIDINPVAAGLIVENAQLNKVSSRVHVHEGDARELVPGLGTFDRVIMNHPTEAVEFFELALGAGRNGTVLHLHIIGTEQEVDAEETSVRSIAAMSGFPGTRTLARREVGTFGPGITHYCLDIELGP